MTALEPRARLTEAERESLLACDCGHDIGGEHNGLGCYAIDWGQTEKGHDVRCRCPETDDRESVNFATAERILAARLAARDAEWRALTEDAIANIGDAHSAHWDPTMRYGAGCETCIANRAIKDALEARLRALVEEVSRGE